MDAEFDALKREFLAEADGKVREISKTFETIDQADRGAGVDRMVYLAHQLKGAGGSYGFERISTEAAELERGLERFAKDDDTGDAESEIHRRLSALSTEIEIQMRKLTR